MVWQFKFEVTVCCGTCVHVLLLDPVFAAGDKGGSWRAYLWFSRGSGVGLMTHESRATSHASLTRFAPNQVLPVSTFLIAAAETGGPAGLVFAMVFFFFLSNQLSCVEDLRLTSDACAAMSS